jgi:hypothetical protein
MLIQDSVSINAPLDVVWDVTVDVDSWHEWSPTVTSIKRIEPGEFGMDKSAVVKQPQMPELIWRVTQYIPLTEFTWTTQMPGLSMTGSHLISREGDATISVLTLNMTGILSVIAAIGLRARAVKTLKVENAGLKTRCESNVSERTG